MLRTRVGFIGHILPVARMRITVILGPTVKSTVVNYCVNEAPGPLRTLTFTKYICPRIDLMPKYLTITKAKRTVPISASYCVVTQLCESI